MREKGPRPSTSSETVGPPRWVYAWQPNSTGTICAIPALRSNQIHQLQEGAHADSHSRVPPPCARQLLMHSVHGSLGSPRTQVPLLEQLKLQHCVFLLQCLPLRLQPGGSAPATPPTPSNPSVPPTRAAPINLSALPREMLPLARALAISSKVRLVVC
jgi:hypothetical protein